MKKTWVCILVSVLCLLFSACDDRSGSAVGESSGSYSSSVESSVPEVSSQPLVDSEAAASAAYQPEADGYYVLYSDDSESSVRVQIPEGYEPLKYTTKTKMDFFKQEEESGWQLIFAIIKLDTAETGAYMLEEVQDTIKMNQAKKSEIGGLLDITAGELQATGFHYFIETPFGTIMDGYRVWMALEDGYTLVFMPEHCGQGVPPMTEKDMTELLTQAVEGWQDGE